MQKANEYEASICWIDHSLRIHGHVKSMNRHISDGVVRIGQEKR